MVILHKPHRSAGMHISPQYENRLSKRAESLILFVVVLDNIARRAVQNIADPRQHVQIQPFDLVGIPFVNDFKTGIGVPYKVVSC